MITHSPHSVLPFPSFHFNCCFFRFLEMLSFRIFVLFILRGFASSDYLDLDMFVVIVCEVDWASSLIHDITLFAPLRNVPQHQIMNAIRYFCVPTMRQGIWFQLCLLLDFSLRLHFADQPLHTLFELPVQEL